ncbi:NAD(P)-dependent oxidoreductase [Actinoplanes sp. L3-i22]|uniref:NAD(P)-dependent oxidoreductase n=1 Tax=Actinoplanes sp. L3-i22 TaxID=2836373 RepID=UPI001C7745BE|nr:NAD(P)H-binding protein [Actinoplanes sp. L3-i22]BCY09195.1 hypothetical protein L3i22_042830 [Actinoplanes sp. L3-i22]
MRQKTFLVFGATGQTGQHFVALALKAGHKVRALARNPEKLTSTGADLRVHPGSIHTAADWAGLVPGADYVVAMLGDRKTQEKHNINTAFVRSLIPAMRAHGVKRLLYQAGGLTRVPGRRLSPVVWTIRKSVARGYEGQHRDNEAVLRYLMQDAGDIEWMVHRAGIGSNGPSRGVLQRSASKISIATFQDCAAYNYRTVLDPAAVHTYDMSKYQK